MRPGGSRRTGEDGFALLATLMVIMVTSVLVLAALSLSFASSVYSGQQVQRDEQTRAADSAIDVGINALQREAETTGTVTDPSTPCELARLNAGGHPEVDVNGTPVVLTCTPVTPDAAPVPDRANTEKVLVVGDAYDGQVAVTDAVPCAVGASCMPWTDALGASDAAAVSSALGSATVRHSGPGALVFSSDVTVRKHAVGVRNPVSTGTRQASPAVAVSGLYRQGDPGLLDPAGTDPVTNDCGIQSRNSPLGVRSVFITSILQEPVCASAQAASIDASSGLSAPQEADPSESPGNLAKLAATNPGYTLASGQAGSMPNCTSGSPDVIRLTPGAYGAAATRTLNSWFRSGGGCDGKVFWFDSGRYYFDVNDSSYGATPNSLVFDDPSSLFVFGAPAQDPVFGGLAWDEFSSTDQVRASFPKACATNDAGTPGRVAGVSVILSSRTSIRHQRGRVSICDQRTNSSPVQAIWQGVPSDPWGPVNPTTVTSPASNGSSSPATVQFANTGGTAAADGNQATAQSSCYTPSEWWREWWYELWNLKVCNPATATLSVTAWSQAVPTSPQPITSLALTISGSNRNVSESTGLVTATVTGERLPGGSAGNPVSCRTQTVGLDQVRVSGIELVSGDCAGKLTDLRYLEGATISISFQYSAKCPREGVPSGPDWQALNRNQICYESSIPYIGVDAMTLTASDVLNVGPMTAPFLITSDAASVSDVATFNVYGQVSIPRADLDIVWAGTPTSDPIFNGTLVVGALGSKATSGTVTTGIVCCVSAQPSERVVQLASWVDVGGGQGKVLAFAQVAIEDRRALVTGQYVYSPGERVRIDEWRLCAPTPQPYPGNEPLPNSVTCRSP